VIDFVCVSEALNRTHLFEGLQHDPALAELSFEEFAPKHQSEECLILRHGLFVQDQIERELTFEV